MRLWNWLNTLRRGILTCSRRVHRPCRRRDAFSCTSAALVELLPPRVLLAAQGFNVVLDPGHAKNTVESTQGATGIESRLPEHELTLDMSRRIRDELVARGFEVRLTRDGPNDVSFSDRSGTARAFADFFVSIHFNGFDGRGTEAFVYSSNNYNLDDDKQFAGILTESVVNSFKNGQYRGGFPGVKVQDFKVIKDSALGNTAESHPVISTLLEIESISGKTNDNRDVDRFFNTYTDFPNRVLSAQSNQNRQLVARNIALGINRARAELFAPDTQPPVVTQVKTSSASVPQNGQMGVSWTAGDNSGGNGVHHVGLFLYNSTGSAAINTAPYATDGNSEGFFSRVDVPAGTPIPTWNSSFNWTVPGNLPSGSYRIRAIAVDAAGNPSANKKSAPLAGEVLSAPFSVTNALQPAISIAEPPSVVEGDSGTKSLSFTVTISPTVNQSVTVHYRTREGTAHAGEDYTAIDSQLTFAPNQPSQTFSIPIIGDRNPESDESFTVELYSPSSNARLGDHIAIATITDPDSSVRIGATVSSPNITEGDSGTQNLNFTVKLSEKATSATSVQWYTVDGSAVAGADYIANNGTLNFAVGEQTKVVTVAVKGDTVAEAEESFYVRLRNPGPGLSIDNVSGTGTIKDNDRPSIAITTSPRVAEGGTGSRNADFVVQLSAPSSETVTVVYTTMAGTATSGADFSPRTDTLTFTPGMTSQTVSVPVLGDAIAEADETFSLRLSNPTNAFLNSATSTAVATIVNDDQSALPLASVTGFSIDEDDMGTKTAVVTVRLSRPSAQTVSVYCQTEDGTAIDGFDYQAKGGPLVFNPGETSKTFTVTILNDTVTENDEFFRVRLSNPSGIIIAADSAQIAIRDNDTPEIVLADQTFVEGTGGNTTATFLVTLSRASSQIVQVDYATSTDGSATSGIDFLAKSGTLVFNPGQTSKTFTITLTGDAEHESNERFYVDFRNPDNVLLNQSYLAGTILDDDAASQPELSINDVTLTEGNSGTKTATFTVTLSSSSSQIVNVDYATANGSAAAGTDYTSASNTLTFNPGQTSKSVSITVQGDTLPEATEEFFVNLLNPVNATLGNAVGRGVIENDDTPAPANLRVSDVTITEGDAGATFANFTVTLSAPSSQTVIVDFESQDGTAEDGSDYIGVSGGLTFNPGVTTRTISVQINGDTAAEGDETFFIRLFNAVNATVSAENGRGTIDNDDFRNLPELSVIDATVAEGQAGTRDLFFTIRLSEQSELPITIDYGTVDGTAFDGMDYLGTSGQLTFIPGETFKVIRVSVLGDTTNESDETFTLNLFNPGNATLLQASAVGIIANDDTGMGQIRGRVFDDLNADAVQQLGERGREGVTVFLDTNQNGTQDGGEVAQVTDSDGGYEFTNLAPGTYSVRTVAESAWMQTFPGGEPGLRQITSNDVFYDIDPQTSHGQVTWQEQQSDGLTTIWLEDATGRRPLIDFPLNTSGGGDPQIDSGQVVFSLVSGTNNQVFIRSGTNTIQLTSNASSNERPQIDRGQVVWSAYNGSTALRDVFLYNGVSITQLSLDDGLDDTNPEIDAGRVVWLNGLNDDSEIMYFDGSTIIQLTDNSFSDEVPQIDDGQATWQGWDGNDYEIFLYNGTSVLQLTNNAYDDVIPQISNGQVAWAGLVGGVDREAFFYNGSQTIQLTDSSMSASTVQIDNGRVVWDGWSTASGFREIFLYDGSTTLNLSQSAGSDFDPEISGNKIVWYGSDGNDYEIFEYVLASAQVAQVSAGHTVAEVDFGTYRLQTVSGQKFNDLNGDGIRNEDEPGLAGWTVELDLQGDGTVDVTTTTDVDGQYRFDDIGPGAYRVSVIPQAEWLSTTADNFAVGLSTEEVGGGEDGGPIDFGAMIPVAVTGTVFDDGNRNGTQDSGEPGLGGWTVTLDLSGGGGVDATVMTEPNGNYRFDTVGTGSHQIAVIPQGAYSVVAPQEGFQRLETISGQAMAGVDFAFWQNHAPNVNAATLTIPENRPQGESVGVISATDPDAGQSRVFAIIAGNTNNAFAIDPATGVLTVNNPAALDFESLPQFDLTVRVTDDGSPPLSGTASIIVKLTNANDIPLIDGAAANLSLNDNATISPFTSLTVTDPDTQSLFTRVSILNGVVRGDFDPASSAGWTRNVVGNDIRYERFFPSAGNNSATAQAAIRTFVFRPRVNAIKPGTAELTDTSVYVSDGQASSTATTRLTTISVNDAPTIGGANGNIAVLDNATVAPFINLAVSDPDVQELATIVRIVNGVFRGDFVPATVTGWTRTVIGSDVQYFRNFGAMANNAAVVQAALRGLVFQPRTNAIKPNTTEAARFTITVADYVAPPVTNNVTMVMATSVNDTPAISGASNAILVNDNATVNPFPTLTIADVDMQEMLISVTILNGVTRGDFTNATSANGWTVRQVLGNNITYKRYFGPQVNVGAAAQAAFRALVFQPRQNAIKPGTTALTDFQVTVSDGVAPAVANTGTRVTTTSVNNAPVIGGAVANQTMNDNQTKAVFSTLTVTDLDTQDQFVRITITSGATRGDFTATSIAGWTRKISGANIVYERFFAAIANNGTVVQAAIRALVFQPRNNVPVGTSETTAFTVFVNDGFANVTNNTTSVITTGVAPHSQLQGLTVTAVPTEFDTTTIVLSTIAKPRSNPLARLLKKTNR